MTDWENHLYNRTQPLGFKQWCEDSGKLWIGASVEEAEKNLESYEAYRNEFEKRKK